LGTFPLFLKLFLRGEENPFGVPFGDAEDLGDLGVTESFDLEEGEDGAALFRELVQELAERHAFGVVDVRRGALGGFHDVVDRRLLDAPAAAAQEVVAGVDEDPVRPRRKRGLARERRGGAMDLEDFMRSPNRR
jgi:hypothetical protein